MLVGQVGERDERRQLTVNDGPCYSIKLQVDDMKIVFVVKCSRGTRSETVDEGEEDSDRTCVETHSGGQGRTVGLPSLTIPDLRVPRYRFVWRSG